MDVGEQSVSMNDETGVVVKVNKVGRGSGEVHILESEISKHFHSAFIDIQEIAIGTTPRWVGDQEIAIHNDLAIVDLAIFNKNCEFLLKAR